jgi:predicted deacylase
MNDSFEKPPRSHTKGHEEKEKTLVSLRVTSWRIFIVSGGRSRHERLLRKSSTKSHEWTRRKRKNLGVPSCDFVEDFHCFRGVARDMSDSSSENPPRSHTKGHEEKDKIFVFLRVTSWRIFIVSGGRSRHERLLRKTSTKSHEWTRRKRKNLGVPSCDFVEDFHCFRASLAT